MECWKCGRPAHGVCKFCGRAVCKDHASDFPSVIAVFVEGTSRKALVVPDALYCGQCHPKDEPVELPPGPK